MLQVTSFASTILPPSPLLYCPPSTVIYPLTTTPFSILQTHAPGPGLVGSDSLLGEKVRGEGEEGTGGGETGGGVNRSSFTSVGQGENKGDNKGDNKGKEGGMGMRGMMGGLISVTGGEGRETMVGSGLHSVDLGSLVDGVVVESGIATPSGLPSPAGSFLFSRNRKANSNNNNNNNNNNANRPGGGGEVAATSTPAIAESYPSSQASLEMLEGKVAMQALLSATTVCLPEGGYLLPLIACQVPSVTYPSL